jgi:hypothetical protein
VDVVTWPKCFVLSVEAAKTNRSNEQSSLELLSSSSAFTIFHQLQQRKVILIQLLLIDSKSPSPNYQEPTASRSRDRKCFLHRVANSRKKALVLPAARVNS